MTLLNRLWLGTVQIGLRYGLAERIPDESEAFVLLDRAWEMGLRQFDTARAYGDSEARIGRWMAARGRVPIIASKLPSLETVVDRDATARVRSAIDQSRAALGRERIDQYLCHRAEDLARPAVRDALAEALDDGRIGAVGVSCYAPEDALAATEGVDRIGLIQLPVNVLNRHAVQSPAQGILCNRGGRLMARSIFLQGVLLLPPERLPTHLAALAPAIQRFSGIAREAAIPRQHLALAFVLDRMPASAAVVGFQKADELDALIGLPESTEAMRTTLQALDGLSEMAPPPLLDPRTWPSHEPRS